MRYRAVFEFWTQPKMAALAELERPIDVSARHVANKRKLGRSVAEMNHPIGGGNAMLV